MKTTLSHHQFFTILGQITNQLVRLIDINHSTNRYLNDFVFTSGTCHIAAKAISTTTRFIKTYMAKISQGIQTLICLQVNATAITAVTTVWSTKFNVFFTPETDTTIASVSGFDCNHNFIYKFHGLALLYELTGNKKAPTRNLSGGAFFYKVQFPARDYAA